jgi:hypothetical protein
MENVRSKQRSNPSSQSIPEPAAASPLTIDIKAITDAVTQSLLTSVPQIVQQCINSAGTPSIHLPTPVSQSQVERNPFDFALPSIHQNGRITGVSATSAVSANSQSGDAIERVAVTLSRQYLAKLPKFSGEPKEWSYFHSVYETTTAQGQYTEADNVARLRESLKDPARGLVSHLLCATDASAIIEALRKVYGRADNLIYILMEELKNGPEMHAENDLNLREFAVKVQSFVATVKSLHRESELRCTYTVTALANKLHHVHYKEWSRRFDQDPSLCMEAFAKFLSEKVMEIHPDKFTSKSSSQSAGTRSTASCAYCSAAHTLVKCSNFLRLSFNDRFKFVKERRICFSCLATGTHDECPSRRTCGIQGCTKTHNHLLHKPEPPRPSDSSQNNFRLSTHRKASGSGNRSHTACAFCDAAHQLFDCAGFLRLTLNDRYRFVNKYKICSACLSSSDHVWRRCPSRRVCSFRGCKQTHHRLLHNTRLRSSSNATVDCRPVPAIVVDKHHPTVAASHTHRKENVLFKVVPLTIYGADGKSLSVHAFLDDGSELTIIDKSIYNRLGLSGSPETIELQWTKGIRRSENSFRTTISIAGAELNHRHELKEVFTVEDLDLPEQTVDVSKLQEKYPHLRGLPLPTMDRAKPMILIGLRHANFLVGHESACGGDRDPVACRTKLGWTVYGANASTPNLSARSFIHTSAVHLSTRRAGAETALPSSTHRRKPLKRKKKTNAIRTQNPFSVHASNCRRSDEIIRDKLSTARLAFNDVIPLREFLTTASSESKTGPGMSSSD